MQHAHPPVHPLYSEHLADTYLRRLPPSVHRPTSLDHASDLLHRRLESLQLDSTNASDLGQGDCSGFRSMRSLAFAFNGGLFVQVSIASWLSRYLCCFCSESDMLQYVRDGGGPVSPDIFHARGRAKLALLHSVARVPKGLQTPRDWVELVCSKGNVKAPTHVYTSR